ncbi:MAG: hypothetical protein ABJB86_02355 [Bacteroidota bacterium]
MKLKVTVNPDPFIAELSVVIQGLFTMNIVIRLANSKGTVIRITACTLKKGENKIQIGNLQRYAAGNYQLEVKTLNGDLVETINLVKM